MNRGLITPTYCLNGIQSQDMAPFIQGIESILRKILPEDLHELSSKKISELKKKLPILHLHLPETAPCTVCVYALFPGEFTGGVGRYAADTLSHWMVPGKFTNICSVYSLNFSFTKHPPHRFFYMHFLIDVYNSGDLAIINNNWPALKKEICLNVLAVKHARQIMSVKKLSFEQKQALIEEHISSVINRPAKDVDLSSFDQMHHMLMQITAEKRLKQIKEQFLPSFEQRPKAYQRDIFHELKHFVVLFGEKFTTLYPLPYVKRLISYQYIFRKSLLRLITSAPEMRHLAIKLIRIQFPSRRNRKTALGIFGALNVLRENELFEERHLIQAIRHSLPNARAVDNTFLLDRHSQDPIRVFYIEIEKKGGSDFKTQEIRQLQRNLTREIKENIESAIHPVFMPRNEEEIMRNILLLSQQLKYVTDLPQVIISFDAQVENDLIFRVILLRILKGKKASLPVSDLTIRDHEVKNVGLLRKKYVKEANIFKVLLNKKKFLRKDFTIDLFKARQALSSELNRIFKGIRDFNGGILSKQQEAFSALRALLKDAPSHKDFLLENFFYSLTPSLHQSLATPSVLKALFLLTLEALETFSTHFIKKQCVENQLLLVITSPNPGLKELLFSTIQTLGLSTAELAVSHVSSYEIHCFGYIYYNPCPVKQEAFYHALEERFSQKAKKRHQKSN
jgi:hypothetical protein